MLARCSCARPLRLAGLVTTRTLRYSTNANQQPRRTPNPTSAVEGKGLAQNPHRSQRLSDPTADVFHSAIIRVRHAIKTKNVQAALEHWTYLKDRNLLRLLGPSQLELVSRLILSAFLPIQDPSQFSNHVERDLVEDVAIIAAVGDAPELLVETMLLHIRRGEPQAAIALYRKLPKLVERAETGGAMSNQDLDSIATTSTNPSSGYLPVLLAAITAHAKLDSFRDAMDDYLHLPLVISPSVNREFLSKLDFDVGLLQRVKAWIPRLDSTRLVSRPPVLSKHVAYLSRVQHSDRLEGLYQNILEGISCHDSYIAADPTQKTESKTISMTEISWTAFIVGFLKCRRRDLAAKVWDDMGSFGVQPGVSAWTALLDAYNTLGAVEDALSAWDMMQSQGIKPDGLTYRALISILFNARRPDDAMEIFHSFQKKAQGTCEGTHVLSIYNTVLHGLLFSDRYQVATSLLESMQGGSPMPDIVSYNTFLAYYGRRSNLPMMASTLEQMMSVGLQGDVFSFSTILSALLKAGREDAPEMVLRLMRKQGVQPNVAIFSAIVDQQMREGSEDGLRAALRMVDEMERDPDHKPNEVTYTSILAGLYQGSWLDVERKEKWRRVITERMRAANIKFNLPAYHILLKACFDYAHPSGVRNALAYYREMRERQILFTQTTWYILLAGLLQNDEWNKANEVVSDMYRSRVRPNRQVSQLVSRIRKRPAQS